MGKLDSYGKHFVDQADIDAVVEVLKSKPLTCGSAVDEFEMALTTVSSATPIPMPSARGV